MTLDQRIRSFVIRIFSDAERIKKSKKRFEFKRKLFNRPHQIEYFHQVDDPYSHLTAQVLDDLSKNYDIELIPRVVCEPNDVDVPERIRLNNYSRHDASLIAPHYNLSFIDNGCHPDVALITRAQKILVKASKMGGFANLAVKVGEALWANDTKALGAIAEANGLEPIVETNTELQNNHKRRAKLGHYLGGTFYYGTEWYWGVDRLNYLEERLNDLGLRKLGVLQSVINRPQLQNKTFYNANDITLEYFCSLRSPYTYISMQQVYDLAQRTGVNFVMRPVLPMMMRGVPATSTKGKYIFSDCRREADHTFNVPFGDICDPIGDPVKRGYSLFDWAKKQGKAEELFMAFTKAAFAERINMGTDEGMQYVVQQAGLSWEEAKLVIDNNGWEYVLEENRLTMYNDMGQWGVPSFRISGGDIQESFSTWGADRLWLVESEIERRCASVEETSRLQFVN